MPITETPPQPALPRDAAAARAESVLKRARETIYSAPAAAVPELMELLAQLSLAGATDEKDATLLRGRTVELLAIGHRLLGNYEAGLQASDDARRIYEELGDAAGVAKACIQAGNLHWALGAFEPALAHYQRALAVRRELGDRRGEAGALGSIGVVLDEMGRLAEARDCYEQSLAISRELEDRMFEGRTLNNLGETCLKLGDHATALAHCGQALDIFRSREEHAEEANALNNIGRANLAAGHHAAAHTALLAAQAVAERIGLRRAQADAHFILGRLRAIPSTMFFSLAGAREAMERALAGARALETRALEAEICRELADVMERAGDAAAALQRYREYHEAQRLVFSAEAERRLRHLQVEMALERARAETRQARARAEELGRLNAELDRQKRQLDTAVRRLLRLDEEKNNLLGMAAHDIRNPLAAIRSLAHLWLTESDERKKAEATDTAQSILTTATATLDLVGKLLDMNAIESGRRTAMPIEVGLGEVLQAVARDYQARATGKSIALTLTVPADEIVVLADPLSLRQILDNLVSNAVKYTPRGGTVTLTVARAADRAAITVADSGPGFTPEDRRRLFQPFARLSARPTGGEHSSGLGLHLVQRLVAELEGDLRCDSEAGRGARMIVTLAAQPPALESG